MAKKRAASQPSFIVPIFAPGDTPLDELPLSELDGYVIPNANSLPENDSEFLNWLARVGSS